MLSFSLTSLFMSAASRSRSRSSASSHKPPAEDTVTEQEPILDVSPPCAGASDAALSAIASRFESGDFPPILPAEIDVAFSERATEALTWIKKDEATRIQSYMHQKYKDYRATLPTAGDRPETVLQAEWARLYYYFHLDAWCCQHGCINSDSFVPAVPPQLLPEADRRTAESLLSQLLGRQSQADRSTFESLVKQELAALTQVLPSSMSPVDVDAAIDSFFTDKYYAILAKYLSDHPRSEFTPMVEVANLSTADQDTFKLLTSQLQASDEKVFHGKVGAAWEMAWAKMQNEHLRRHKHAIQTSWCSQNYVGMLQEYVSERSSELLAEAFVFEPLVLLADLASEAECVKAREIMARVESRHVAAIDRAVDGRWHDFLKALPSQLPQHVLKQIRSQWLTQHYFTILGEVLEAACVSCDFCPLVPLDELPEGKEREEARALLQLMTPELGETLKARVELESLEAFRSCDLGELQHTVEHHWLVANYYRFMAEAVRGISAPVSVVTTSSPAVPSMFESPKKRARRAVENEPAAMVARSVAESHTADIALSRHNRTEVYLLDFADQLRFADVRDKKTSSVERVPVLSCLFGDRTGAIQADLWRQVAETHLALFLQWSEASDDPVLLEISGFGVKADRRRSLRSTRQLSINDNTTITRLETGSLQSILSPEVPIAQDLVVTDFRHLSGSLPFLANLNGYVMNLSEVSYSRQEVSMRTFRLQDASGRYVTCCLHGRHSTNQSLAERAQITVFFATATQSLGSNPSMLWLYDNSHLVIQRLGCSVPPSTQAVQLGATSSNSVGASSERGA